MKDVLRKAKRLRARGRPKEAIPVLEAALKSDPENRVLLAALAETQGDARLRRDSFMTYNRLIALGDVPAETWTKIGHSLVRAGEFAQSINAFEESLKITETADARHHLGQSLFRMGDIDAAIGHLERAAREHGLLASWLALATIVPGAPSVTQERILEFRREFAAALSRSPQAARPPARRHPAPRGDDRLRIGYLSSWFASSNYMKPVWALINNHDRDRVAVQLFSDNPVSEAFEGYDPHPADTRHFTGRLDNTRLAKFIARADIDVLVDLNAYSTAGRLGLFMVSPAPVTVAWFNMYATSGLPGIDAIIGDDQTVKPGEDRFYSEEVLRLPVSYLTFTTPHRTPAVADPPCLGNGHFTFGSLIAQYKMTPDVIAAWAAMLNGVPGSRLVLANRAFDLAQNRAYVARSFAAHGVAAERLTMHGPAPHFEYLQYYDQIDLALDAFPYNGGTTTMEAIWQGVPVATFDGDRWASRTSQTLLRRTHLGKFVFGSREEMVEGAIGLARDPATPARLTELRHTMRDRLEGAPVCDAAALARSMEDLLAGLAAKARAGAA